MSKARNEYMADRIAEYGEKYNLSAEQAIRIIYNTEDFHNIWNIAGLDDYLLDVADKYDIKL